jgi:hypothetical protein
MMIVLRKLLTIHNLVAILVVVAVVWVVVCYCQSEHFHSDLVPIKSTVDGRVYTVRDMPDRQQASDLLATARQRLMNLCDKLERHYPKDERVALLVGRFRPDAMSELSAQADPKYTSYAVSKGKQIIFCLRSRDKAQKLISLQTLMFVAIHELAHVMSVSVGHTEEFWENMRFLLANGIEWGLYKPVDYSKKPQPYCGLQITSSPLAPGAAARMKYVTYDESEVIEAEFDNRNDASIH